MKNTDWMTGEAADSWMAEASGQTEMKKIDWMSDEPADSWMAEAARTDRNEKYRLDVGRTC